MPSKANGNIAINGCFDLPKRTGTTYFSWPLSDSVEPFVDSEDIKFDEREITLAGIITGNSNVHVFALESFLNNLPELFILSCKWGSWNVKYKSVNVSPADKNNSKIEIRFTEPNPDLIRVLPPESDKKDIDDYDWLSFGLWLKEIQGYQSLGFPKTLNVTQNISSSLPSSGGKNKTEITITGNIVADSFEKFKSNIAFLHTLFSEPGLRTIRYRGHEIKCFCVNGFSVSDVYVRNKVCAKFSCKLIVIENGIVQDI